MRLPWTKQTENYQDQLHRRARCGPAKASPKGRTAGAALVSETGALESAAGLVGRAFMSAGLAGEDVYTRALTPQVMELIGRALLRQRVIACSSWTCPMA